MALEVIYSTSNSNPFKVDIFSFKILYCNILISIENKYEYIYTSIHVKRRLKSLYKFDHRLQLWIKECLYKKILQKDLHFYKL